MRSYPSSQSELQVRKVYFIWRNYFTYCKNLYYPRQDLNLYILCQSSYGIEPYITSCDVCVFLFHHRDRWQAGVDLNHQCFLCHSFTDCLLRHLHTCLNKSRHSFYQNIRKYMVGIEPTKQYCGWCLWRSQQDLNLHTEKTVNGLANRGSTKLCL